MNIKLEQAKEALLGRFCIRQIEMDEAKQKGEKLMSAQDIRYLRAFKVESHHFKLLTLSPEKGARLKKEFLEEKITEARIKKLMGIQISDREIYSDAIAVIKESNLFVSHNQMKCVELTNYTYFFFDEEHKIIHEIIKFQDFFGALASVARLI